MFRPWLLLPAKLAHDVAPLGLDVLMTLTREVRAECEFFDWQRRSRKIHFRNPLGVAGGVDKNGTQIRGWRHFGAGFVEIGTVTPKPQSPNAGKIIDRDNKLEALWNRMGFPGRGAAYARASLKDFRRDEFTQETASALARFPVFVNIGKQRETPLENASADYTSLIDFFSDPTGDSSSTPLVDAFVINISSPNTAGLRDLFSRERLHEFLAPIAERLNVHSTPGLLKLSPDMDRQTLESAVDVSVRLGLDGFIATNTTAFRREGWPFPAEGGVSGAPLTLKSREVLKNLIEILGSDREGRLIVSVGGVLTGDEAAVRIAMGANLVQTYSGLVFSGPRFFDHALRVLESLPSVR